MLERLKDESKLLIVGHRGHKSAYPENTLLAFQKVLELGIDVLEFDLHLSKDKEIVVIHDDTLERTTNGTGRVHDYTLSELKQLDAGGWLHAMYEGLKIPTLAELCELLQNFPDVLLNVEIKAAEYAFETSDKAIQMLTEFNLLERCLFTSFDAKIVAYIHDHYGLKTQGFPAEKMYNFDEGEHGTYSKMWSIGISRALLTKELVTRYKQMGLVVGCYVVDTFEQIEAAIDCGIHLITCDNPIPALQYRSNS